MKILDVEMILHGGDYNPDQWKDYPEILEQDMRLLKAANINFVSINIFSWIQLEREEGIYTFDWLDQTINRLHEHGFKIVLATPSGSKPAWLTRRYPDSARVDAYGRRAYHGNRHNHCMTSPSYREKVFALDSALAKRYGEHPAVMLWHISNEFSGFCYCDLCQAKFRNFLQEKYQTIETLNQRWWNAFWSHDFTSFEEIHPPMPIGEQNSVPLELDWHRFTTENTIDFYKEEVRAIRQYSTLPTTTNFPPISTEPLSLDLLHLDCFAFAKHLDMVAYDSYPQWHSGDDYQIGLNTSMLYDLMRSLKGNRPFLLMESAPSAANWRNACKLKRPKMHALSSIQAVAHGADMVGYFQMRKGRGQTEKFHSAVLDHDSTDDNRVYQDVKALGASLKDLAPILGSTPKHSIAIYLDWSNHVAIRANKGPRMVGVGDLDTIQMYYKAIVSQGYGVDFVNYDSSLDRYKVIVLPMVYSAPDAFWQKLHLFKEKGGIILSTYMSGYANDDDLIYPRSRHPLFEASLGLVYHELDALEEADKNSTVIGDNCYAVEHFCELNKLAGAEVMSRYQADFYQGEPCITHHQGHYHVAGGLVEAGLTELIHAIFTKHHIEKTLELAGLPLIATHREIANHRYLFIMNFTQQEHALPLQKTHYTLDNQAINLVRLTGFAYIILKENR